MLTLMKDIHEGRLVV